MKIAVIVPTHARTRTLFNALTSVINQERLPDRIIVVGDTVHDIEEIKTSSYFNSLPVMIEWLINNRTKGLSGSLNTGLLHLIRTKERPEDTFIATLDDDDIWDPSYLGKCLCEAESKGLDWVYSGIVRHEPDGQTIEMSVPKEIDPTLFLRGNPHIQGSNLFIRFSKILEAGMFDENLPSTTDRDLCIRLLDLGDCSYGPLDHHLVHHYAGDHPRLSTPGSESKRLGLERFLLKYRSRMSDEDVKSFIERSKRVFNIDMAPQFKDATTPSVLAASENSIDFQLIIGFTASFSDCAWRLVKDIVRITNLPSPLKVVICDNCCNGQSLEGIVEYLRENGIDISFIPSDRIDKDASGGLFGEYYLRQENRKGIAYGRTALHHYLYQMSYDLENPVVWILDDDVRLNNIKYQKDRIDFTDLRRIISNLINDGVSVAIGGISGDPPLPVSSSIRVQLLEMFYALRSISFISRSSPLEWEVAYRNYLKGTYPDYYYDTTLAHYGHLETPLDHRPDQDIDVLTEKIGHFYRGHDSFRPAKEVAGTSSTIITRGGNTMVLDVDVLKTYPNSAPIVNGIDLRRGDTLWAILVENLGTEMMLRRKKSVISIPLSIEQERHDNVATSYLLGDKLISDIWGTSFTKAFKNTLNSVVQDEGRKDPWNGLKFTQDEISSILNDFHRFVHERALLISANVWRISGLVKSIRTLLSKQAFTLENDPKQTILTTQVEQCLDWIESEYTAEKVQAFFDRLLTYDPEDIRRYVLRMHETRSSYSTRQPMRVSRTDIDLIQNAMDGMGIKGVHPLAKGGEGIVFTDGIDTYKYFYAGVTHFDPGSLSFLRSSLAPTAVPNHVVSLKDVIEKDGHIVFKMPLVEGTDYQGGQLSDILDLLNSCRDTGIAMKNISPDNMKVSTSGLVFTDLGRDIKPYSDGLFREMCKRVYLCYRWHFRPDIKELMRRSLRDEDMPELFGLDYFFEALDGNHDQEHINDIIGITLSRIKGKEILDYGCREGALSNVLAENGSSVRCYDIDMSRFCMVEHPGDVGLITREMMDARIKANDPFETIFCCRVLCSVKDDEVKDILADLRGLVAHDGHVVIGICNPLNLEADWTPTHQKLSVCKYDDHSEYCKSVSSTGRTRPEHHRPISWYIDQFNSAGFIIEQIDESDGLDIRRLSPSSELLFFTLRPVNIPPASEVTLLIKASPMEWRTIDHQIRHIVKQLEGPERFQEIIIATDDWNGPFARQYNVPDREIFTKKLDTLVTDGVIDRYVVFKESSSLEINHRWFGITSSASRSKNDQPVHMFLNGLEECHTNLVLQIDSDCLIVRKDRSDSYLERMIGQMKEDDWAISISLPIYSDECRPFTDRGGEKAWRTEVRCCLISKERLMSVLPLKNSAVDGTLSLTWHRSLDEAVERMQLHSYRGGGPSTSFIHVPNDRKRDSNEWFNIMQMVEIGRIPHKQLNTVDLVGTISDWLEPRTEQLIFIMRGRDVPIPIIRRCLNSITEQSKGDWGLIIIDAASSNGTQDFIKNIVMRHLSGRVTFLQNIKPLTPIENIDAAIRRLCTNSESVIAMVDSDDALIGKRTAEMLMDLYNSGVDLTIGGMLRTDKYKIYPVDFLNPRTKRGNSLWQHLKTFRKDLYDRVPQDYLKLDDEWVPNTEDWAFMIPMVELSIKPFHIQKSIYFYQPSPQKSERSIKQREEIISRLLSKPSLKEVNS